MAVYVLQVHGARAGGQSAGRRASRAAGARGHPDRAGHGVDVAARRGALRRHVERRAAGPRRSACWCRCCFRSCRCCTCGSCGRRCCCATRRRRGAPDWTRIAAMALVSLALVGVAALAGGIAQGRRRGVRRFRGAGGRAAAGRRGARDARRAAGAVAVVSAAARRAAPVASGQSDAGDPACGRPWRLLHRRHPLAAGESLEEFSVQVAADAPDMFLLDIQRDQVDGVRAFLAIRRTARGASRLIPVLRARVDRRARARHATGRCRAGAPARIARPRVHDYVSRSTRAERASSPARFWSGPSTEPEVSIEDGIARAVPDRRRRHDPLRHPGADD